MRKRLEKIKNTVNDKFSPLIYFVEHLIERSSVEEEKHRVQVVYESSLKINPNRIYENHLLTHIRKMRDYAYELLEEQIKLDEQMIDPFMYKNTNHNQEMHKKNLQNIYFELSEKYRYIIRFCDRLLLHLDDMETEFFTLVLSADEFKNMDKWEYLAFKEVVSKTRTIVYETLFATIEDISHKGDKNYSKHYSNIE